jgi:hypothetical protein
MTCFDQGWEVGLGQDGRSVCGATACVVRYSCILRGQGQRLEAQVNVLRDDYSHTINADCSSATCSSIKLNLSTNTSKKWKHQKACVFIISKSNKITKSNKIFSFINSLQLIQINSFFSFKSGKSSFNAYSFFLAMIN